MEDVRNSSQMVLRRRLREFALQQLSAGGRVRVLDDFEQWTRDEALWVERCTGYLWLRFGDGRWPRAAGIRYLGQRAGQCWYGIALLRGPGDLEVSRWCFCAGEGWSRRGG